VSYTIVDARIKGSKMIAGRLLGVALVVFIGQAGAQPATQQPSSDPLELVTQGRRLNSDGKQDEALALFKRALELKPDLFEAHLAAGVALDLKGQYSEARAHLTKSISLAPDEGKDAALNAMAVSYAFEGRAKDAAAFYGQAFDRQMAASQFGNAAATANALGRVHLETGDAASARRWYQTGYETSRRQPNEPGADLDLWEFRWVHAQARLASREGKPDEAARLTGLAKAMIESKPSLANERPSFEYLVGYVAFHGGNYDGAIAGLLQADQRDPFILGLLAQAYEKRGDRGKARQYYTQALASNAHNLQNAFTRELARKKLAR
jgi:tetratricopeptide (TPR) repeat protein